jgi:hypothetical protein
MSEVVSRYSTVDLVKRMERKTMEDRTPWLKRVGALWLATGGVGVIWAVLTLLRGMFAPSVPSLLAFLAPAMLSKWVLWPWAQLTVLLAAVFMGFSGWGLMRRQRWTQTLMVPAHLIFMIYALAIWVAAFLVKGHLYEGWGGLSLGLLAAIALNGTLAVWMNSVGTSEALSWLPLRTAPLVPLKCEFCGTPLDPQSGRCPQCEAELQATPARPVKPPEAMLVGTTDEREFYITADQSITIGRGSARNEVNLSNPTVSRRHAQIVYEKGRYVLRALDDRNGTFVNNTRIRQQTLHDGDEIRFGRASYGFRIVE